MKPKILLLVDKPGWAFDTFARGLSTILSDQYDFIIKYVVDKPDLYAVEFDILHVFFWGETWYQQFGIQPSSILKMVSSHRWATEAQYGNLNPAQMVNSYLSDADNIVVVSKRLYDLISPHRQVVVGPEGYGEEEFYIEKQRSGPLKIGWAGNIEDQCKGFLDIIQPACANGFELSVADGKLSHSQMCGYFNDIDILCVASTAEGGPRTLLESMACGCFPVCVDVGIVPELIQHCKNGLVVNRNIAAFQAAFHWCRWNLEYVRKQGKCNAFEIVKSRSWKAVRERWNNVYQQALNNYKNTSQKKLGIRMSNIDTAQLNDNVIHSFKKSYSAHYKSVNIANDFASGYHASRDYYMAEVMPLLPQKKDCKVIDLGIGHGHLLQFFLENGFLNIFGVEIDPILYAEAKKRFGNAINLIEDDAMNYLAKMGKSFDIITAFDIIEHFTFNDAVRLATLARQALKEGGAFIVRTPNMANILGCYSRYMDVTHLFGYTEFSLKQLLLASGFEHIELHLPQWEGVHPFAQKFKSSAQLMKEIFELQDRCLPKCFDKNIVMCAR